MSNDRISELAKELSVETEATEAEAVEHIRKMVSIGYGLYVPDFKANVKRRIEFDEWKGRATITTTSPHDQLKRIAAIINESKEN